MTLRAAVVSHPGPALALGGTRPLPRKPPVTNILIRPYRVRGEQDAPEEMARRRVAADAQAGLARLQEAAARQRFDRVGHEVDVARRSLEAAEHVVDVADTAHLTAHLRNYLEQQRQPA